MAAVDAGVITWPEFCGNRSGYDVFWNRSLTLDTYRPVLTSCFQKTVLVWLPCGWLWAASLVCLPSLWKQPTVHAACNISKFNLWKMVLTTILVLLSGLELSDTIAQGENPETSLPPPLADYVALGVETATLILAAFLTRYSYTKGHHTSGQLFIFWLLMSVCSSLQLVSMTGMESVQEDNLDQLLSITFCIHFALLLLMLITNIFADTTAIVRGQEDSWENGNEEKKPLIIKHPKKTASRNLNPFDYAGFLSKIFFFWFGSFVIKGYRKLLVYGDIWDIRKEDASHTIVDRFEKGWDQEVAKCARQGKEPSLAKVLLKAFYRKLFVAGGLLLMYQSFLLLNPNIMNAVIGFVQGDNPYSWQGYLLAVGMYICSMLGSICMHQSSFFSYHNGMHIKSAIITAVYRKSLRISSSARRSVTTGEIVNLISVDAQKVCDSQMYVHYLWVAFVTVGISMYMLYQKLGVSCFIGLAYLIILIPINSNLVSRLMGKYQRIQLKYKDIRIKLMSQILSGIKVLKLYAWEPYFEKRISEIRKEELKSQRMAAIVDTVNYILAFSSNFLVALLCFTTYVLLSSENVLTPDIAFVSISLFGVLSGPLVSIPMAVTFLVNGLVSVGRIQKFLLQPELDPENVQSNFSEGGTINIRNGSFSWGDEDRIPLKDIEMSVEEGSLVAVVGAVGTGKSSLVQAMLGEMDVLEGRVNVKGSVAYVAQQAWIQNLTVRDNILFEKPFYQHKYDQVLDACALTPDLKILSGGDMTEIGERGINLSGGQKQRVSLARAVYQNADIYLLDDPLSAVDSHVGKHIFDKVIGQHGMLAHKTRVLVTNSLIFLSQVDKIVVLKDGTISEMGAYDELLRKNGAFAELIAHYLAQTVEEDSASDEEIETMKEDLRRTISQCGESEQSDGGTLVRSRSKRRKTSTKQLSVTTEDEPKKKEALILEEAVKEGAVKLGVIRDYTRAASVRWSVAALLGLVMNVGGVVGANVWLSEWSNDGVARNTSSEQVGARVGVATRLEVYGALGLLQTLGLFLLSWSVACGCIEAARTLHERLLKSNLRSPMSFFDTTPLGRILNRFSKDIDTVDFELRMFIQAWLSQMGAIISVLIIITYSTPIFIVVLIPLGIIFVLLQRVYITTARQIKRIHSAKSSPIFANFSETLNGVSSIRAYKQQTRFTEHADKLLDDTQKIWFPVFASNRWICIYSESLGSLMVLFAAIFCVLQRDTLDGGTVGLSLSFALQISLQITVAVRSSCELETKIVSVERIKEYSETEQEADRIMDHRPPGNWPHQGVIEFQNFSTRYRAGLDLVVKDLSCHINPSEMVGIVGRTGAGKSSMTLALFRIIESAGGRILIDGENISQMGLHDLRSKLTIIPQDPVLFSGSLRFNLDPADRYSDDEVWTALEQAHLKDFVSALPDSLRYESGEDGQNFSVGQRQLVCLARALLRKTKILVMDEATAAVDLETDDLIQNTIRTEFKGCTVLTIAHRLNTIMDYDRVMVLDKGMIKEFDSPDGLLSNTSGIFHSMASDAGLV